MSLQTLLHVLYAQRGSLRGVFPLVKWANNTNGVRLKSYLRSRADILFVY